MTIIEILGIAFVSFIVYITLTIFFLKYFFKRRLNKVIGILNKKQKEVYQ